MTEWYIRSPLGGRRKNPLFAVSFGYIYTATPPAWTPVASTDSARLVLIPASAGPGIFGTTRVPKERDTVLIANASDPALATQVNYVPDVFVSPLYSIVSLPTPESQFYVLEPYNVFVEGGWRRDAMIYVADGPAQGGRVISQITPNSLLSAVIWLDAVVVESIDLFDADFFKRANNYSNSCDRKDRIEFSDGEDCSSDSDSSSCSSSYSSSSCSDNDRYSFMDGIDRIRVSSRRRYNDYSSDGSDC